MLDKIRENSRSIGTYLIFGAIIVVFVAYFGPGSQGCTGMGGSSDGGWAATVNGEEIGVGEFRRSYEALMGAYRQQAGGNFTEEMAEAMGIKQTVLDGLVERRLLIDVAERQGIAVPEAEIKETIRGITAFHKDGAFDFATYKAVLANVGQSPDKFEAGVREDLLRGKLVAEVRQAAKVTDAEIEEAYVRENDKASVTFVRFAPGAFIQDAAVTPDAAQAYLATEEGKAAVQKKFETESFKYKQPKRVAAQHILVKVAEDAPEADVEAAKAKLADAKRRIEGGEDFGAVAQELSEDAGSAKKGGDLGLFGPGTMAKPFEQAAMELEPGKLSDFVRTRFGLHLIKVNDVQPASEKKLEEVQEQIAAELLKDGKAKELAKARAEEALAQARAGKALEELYPAVDPAAGEPAVKPQAWSEKTGPFAVANEFVPRVGASGELAAAVRAAAQGDVLPKVFELNGNWIVAKVDERIRPDMARLDESKEAIRERVLARKQAELERDFVAKLREQADVRKNEQIFGPAEADATAAAEG